MRLSELDNVNRMALDRRRLLKDLEALAAGKLRVTIDGEPQDEAMLSLAAVHVEGELKARISKLERELDRMGIYASL